MSEICRKGYRAALCYRAGRLVPGQADLFVLATHNEGLHRTWDRDAIRAYAEANDWEERMKQLEAIYEHVEAQSNAVTNGESHHV